MTIPKTFVAMMRCPASEFPLTEEDGYLVSADGTSRYAIDSSGIPLFAEAFCSDDARRQQQHYDKIAEAYLTNLGYPHTQEYMGYLDEAFLQVIGSAELGNVLEICCGGGESFQLLGERVRNGIGVDISALVRRDGPYPGGKGAPVKEAFPKEGGSLLPIGLAITKGGPNPAATKAFVDWLTSLEGQKAVNRLGHFSLRKDFTSVEGDDLSKLKYHWWDADELDKYRDQWTAEALKILN